LLPIIVADEKTKIFGVASVLAQKSEKKNEIVADQSDEIIRLEVRVLDDEGGH